MYSLKLKLSLFQSNVLYVLNCAMECLKLATEQEKRLTTFENNYLHRILRIKWRDRVINDEIRTHTGQPDIATVVRQSRWQYFGHILCIPDHIHLQIILHWQPEGTHHRGRRKNTLCRTYERDRRFLQTSLIPEWEDIYAAAQMREE